MSRVVWTESAQHDLAALDDWYDGVAPDYADRIGRAALAAARLLASHPSAGPLLVTGLRKWTLRGTPFILVYREGPSGVEIIRFLHARSDWHSSTR